MSVLKPRQCKLANVDILQISMDKICFLPPVHSFIIKSAEVDYQQGRQLDNVNLLCHFPSSPADITLEIVHILLLQVQLQTLLDTGPVVVLGQGERQHGEMAVGH